MITTTRWKSKFPRTNAAILRELPIRELAEFILTLKDSGINDVDSMEQMLKTIPPAEVDMCRKRVLTELKEALALATNTSSDTDSDCKISLSTCKFLIHEYEDKVGAERNVPASCDSSADNEECSYGEFH